MTKDNGLVKINDSNELSNIENLAVESLNDDSYIQRFVVPIAILPYEFPELKDPHIYMLLSSIFPTNIRIFSREEFTFESMSYFCSEKVMSSKILTYRHDINKKEDCTALLDIIYDLNEKNNTKVEWGDYIYQSLLLQKRYCEGLKELCLDPNDKNKLNKTFKFDENNGLELFNLNE